MLARARPTATLALTTASRALHATALHAAELGPASDAAPKQAVSAATSSAEPDASPTRTAAAESVTSWLAARKTALGSSIRQSLQNTIQAVQPGIRDAGAQDVSITKAAEGVASITPSEIDAATTRGAAGTDDLVRRIVTIEDVIATPLPDLPVVAQQAPEFTVVSAGLGSMLVAKLPPGTKVYTQKGVSVGQSASIRTFVAAGGSPLASLKRKLQGGPMFFQVFSTPKAESGDVLIAPKGIGDLAVLEMDGSAEYYIRRHSYLASTTGISLNMRLSGLTMSPDTGIVHYRASGKGKLAITTYGGLYRLVLTSGEVYRVSPKHLIAWNTSMIPEPVNADQVIPEEMLAASKTDATGTTVAVTTATTTEEESGPARAWTVVKDMARDAMSSFRGIGQGVRSRIKYWALGQEELVELTGPGDVYIASRILPRFDLLRNMSSTNAEEKKQQQAPAEGVVAPMDAAASAAVKAVGPMITQLMPPRGAAASPAEKKP
ncbi:hypothetical protein AMAG_09069 [Allomyces macrogynus ATCC 38327]|uniref:Altered inheritance of mitochondria protein 24, mitochondrial n=1 Tax=Allomyces macrogynus (strain ATCC 38327) TaxID=578462 RepID=A0A0L0SNR1_ALLM3|nr:hypothetical protein AMAG_09069 [Allomyces macrogynus ATCC 38327]|eukprot:KNE64009.1 hypothetical protein AMAG_09069 [Allomyces macrogynus ATCC 38327]